MDEIEKVDEIIDIEELAEIIFRLVHPNTFICLFVSKKWYRVIRNMYLKNKDCAKNDWNCLIHNQFIYTCPPYSIVEYYHCYLTFSKLLNYYFCRNQCDRLSLNENRWLIDYVNRRDLIIMRYSIKKF